MSGSVPSHFSETNFDQQVLAFPGPVLVDFWAGWCQPCRMFAPTIEQLAAQFEGRAKIGKVDVDANEQLARRYQIQSIPTSLLFVDGQVVERFVGMVSKNQLEQAIERSLRPVGA